MVHLPLNAGWMPRSSTHILPETTMCQILEKKHEKIIKMLKMEDFFFKKKNRFKSSEKQREKKRKTLFVGTKLFLSQNKNLFFENVCKNTK